MKKYLLFLIIITPLVLGGLTFGPKSGASPWTGPKAKSVFNKSAAKLYSEETLRNDLYEKLAQPFPVAAKNAFRSEGPFKRNRHHA